MVTAILMRCSGAGNGDEDGGGCCGAVLCTFTVRLECVCRWASDMPRGRPDEAFTHEVKLRIFPRLSPPTANGYGFTLAEDPERNPVSREDGRTAERPLVRIEVRTGRPRSCAARQESRAHHTTLDGRREGWIAPSRGMTREAIPGRLIRREGHPAPWSCGGALRT